MKRLHILIVCGLVTCTVLCHAENRARDIGLVLSGGGAKGAYEVGAWQAICEAGLDKRICAMSGTSVGSINSVLFASVMNPKLCERFWLEVVPHICKPNEKLELGATLSKPRGEDIAAIKTRLMEEKAKKLGLKVSDLSVADEEEALSMAVREWKECVALRGMDLVAGSISAFGSTNDVLRGFADGEIFRHLLSERIPGKWALDNVCVYATALKKGVWHKEVFRLDHQPKERVLDVLLASSSIPLFFDSQRVDGGLYVDGGWERKGGDNVPIDPILENHPEVKTIIVVYLADAEHLYAPQRDRVRKAAEQKNVRLVEIIPSSDTGGYQGVFNTSSYRAKRLIDCGREDAQLALKKAGFTK